MLDANLIYLGLVVCLVVMGFQTIVLMRMRNLLQAVSQNFESVLYYFRKFLQQSQQMTPVAAAPKTCQFCRHRLAYINTSKTRQDENDFYHVCGLRNKNITLNDSCEAFEIEGDREQP